MHSPHALDRLVPLGLALYFGLHLISRVLVSPSLELDEAEQLLYLQALSLGYGFQPPLYTWLQALVFAFTGPGVFGLALLKAVLLWLTWWALAPLARPATVCFCSPGCLYGGSSSWGLAS